jgi:hypothetical protein
MIVTFFRFSCPLQTVVLRVQQVREGDVSALTCNRVNLDSRRCNSFL